MSKKISITLIRSAIGRKGKHKQVAIGLGLTKLNRTVIRDDSPEIRGMVNKISYLVEVKPV
ncbi:MAG TPA: 50S ribosomal protein L30 [Nitrospiria bacterium]|nr:50S ribosomal protein L30 [Nitrospiria bacterium]